MPVFCLAIASLVVCSACSEANEASSGTTEDAGTSGKDGNPSLDIVEADDLSVSDDTLVSAGPTVIKFGLDPIQPISAGPFPNNLYLSTDGVAVARLSEDPVLRDVALPEVVEQWSEVMNQRPGFGSTSPVYFFTTGEVDESSLEGMVTIVALEGRDAGRNVQVQAWFDARWNVIGVYPAWGDYLEPGSTYGVIIRRGVTSGGIELEAPETLTMALQAEELPAGSEQLRAAYAPLREYLGSRQITVGDVVGATVFTTQEVLAYGEAFFAGADAFTLGAISRKVRWDTEASAWVEAQDLLGDALDTYFGAMPTGAYQYNPGLWSGLRENISLIPGDQAPHDGGLLHQNIGRVINGSIEAPAFNYQRDAAGVRNTGAVIVDGQASTDVTTLIPFTLILCNSHLESPGQLPVALFSHGGGAQRTDVLPWANLGCLLGVATISIDMPYHGGRRLQEWLPDEARLVPAAGDAYNGYTELSEGEPGYQADYVGDPTSAAENVGPMYALNLLLDPDVVEANLMTYAVDNYVMTRYLAEADWTGLVSGLSFDQDRIFHYSLSFGTTFTTAMHALRQPFLGVIGSVGTGAVFSVNMTNGPANSSVVSGVLSIVLGLQSTGFQLSTTTLRDVGLGLHQWLHERGDSLPYAPFVLRYREGQRTPTLHSANSWDETLFNPAQLSYQNALGIPAYAHGEEWTLDPSVPGANLVQATDTPTALINNASFEGESVTAGVYYYYEDCHAQVVSPICTTRYGHPYPPATLLEAPSARLSPICALQHQSRTFIQSLLDGSPAKIVPPEGDCESLYGPQ